jgi:DNA invertase Pin-like site-specific DNA recombinase
MSPKSSTPLRLDGIVRVSKTGDRDTLRSPEQQERDIRRWAKEHGHEIVHVHVAIDQTGRKRTGHPAIEAAKKRALDGVVDGVVAAYVSRFTRNTLYGLATVAELLDAGRYFFAPECPFDLRTPEGRKYLTGLLAEAEYEGDVKAGHFARGVEEAIERGAHLAARYGYEKGNGKAEPLTVVKAEAKQVKRAFELRASGHTWPAIAKALNESGAKPRPYKRDGVVRQATWTFKTVKQIVGSEVYTGVAFHGTHRHENAHPAIVSEELYAAANETKGTKPLAPAEGYLLSGLVRCKGCGYAMTYASERGRLYLRCRSAQHGDGRCPEPAACPAEPLEQLVWEQFEADNFDDDGLVAEPVEDTNGHMQAASERLAAARTQAKRAMELYTLVESESGRGQAAEQVKAADREVAAAERGLGEARNRVRRSRLPGNLTAEEARAFPIPDRRHWLSSVYAAVVVRKARVWREPVADRQRVVPIDDAPGNGTALRGFVVATQVN